MSFGVFCGRSGTISTRRFHLGWASDHPEQARQLAWLLQDGTIQARFLLCDRDSKFTAGFDEVFRSEGVEVIRLPYRSPHANSRCERWISSVRRE